MSNCEFCNEKLNGIPIICPKCGKEFCSNHKFPKDHNCVNIDKKEEKETEGPVDKEHDKREEEKEAYIEEEVKIIKRRVKNETKAVKFFRFIINHHMAILLLALVITGFYVQNQGIYDIKGKAFDVFDAIKFMVTPEKESPIIENTTELTKVNDTSNQDILEDRRTFIQKIQDTPSLYVNTDIEVEGFVEWKEVETDTLEFQYVIYDENRRYIPFLFDTQNVGFNKYFKYKIYGRLLKDGDRVYIDATDYERMI